MSAFDGFIYQDLKSVHNVYKLNERQFARLLHRSSTFPASARTAVWHATLLTLKLDSAEVSLYRYEFVAVRSA